MARSVPAVILLAALLASCGQEQKQTNPDEQRDPAMVDALSDPLMADPDLATQNRGGSALSGGGPASGQIPPLPKGPEEIEAAKQAALDLAGGAISSAPAASTRSDTSRRDGAITAEALAAASGLVSKGCAGKLAYSFVWAARLAPALMPFPRGHVQEAAGSDDPACRIRVVNYLTPVEPAAVVDFHFAMAAKGKLQPSHTREGDDDVISGRGYAVFVRPAQGGLTQVDVVSAGL
ncbi:MAG TPA: hypothetical protein PK479_05435 [Novosphingobium sp.]|nr:hypothetical protein [Novosphingobium sp.]HNN55572.1 hypothetical protein [Novosphingobium sp.]